MYTVLEWFIIFSMVVVTCVACSLVCLAVSSIIDSIVRKREKKEKQKYYDMERLKEYIDENYVWLYNSRLKKWVIVSKVHVNYPQEGGDNEGEDK